MSIPELNSRFQYKTDTENHKLQEKWTILRNPDGPLVGDCEDYALTALWFIKGKSDVAFHQSLQNGQAKIWYCYTPSGEAHALLEFNGKMIDNIQQVWNSKETLEGKGYKFSYVMSYKEVKMRLNAGQKNKLPFIPMAISNVKEKSKSPALFIGVALAVGAIVWLITQ